MEGTDYTYKYFNDEFLVLNDEVLTLPRHIDQSIIEGTLIKIEDPILIAIRFILSYSIFNYMDEFKISEEDKKLFIAEHRSDKSIRRYEFEKIDSGWYVKKFIYKIEEGFPKVSDMYLPNEVVEKILMVESVKDKLTDTE